MGSIVKVDHLLWADLETTGTDPQNDLILEVGVVYTDLELNPIWEHQSLVVWRQSRIDAALNDFTRKMHTDNGLLADLRAASGVGPSMDDVTAKLVGSIPVTHTVALAGSGIAHLDHPFIKEWMPRLAKRLEYYTIDTGVLRRCLRIFGGEQYAIEDMPDSYDTDVKAHRALADVRAHLREARAYRDKLQAIAESAWRYEDLANS